jgi:hypothetical protein
MWTIAWSKSSQTNESSGSVSAATADAPGITEYATAAETYLGTDDARSVTPAGLKATVPFKTNTNLNLYVNSGAAYGSWGAGNDTNDGSQATPFATITTAISKIPQIVDHIVNIYLAGTSHYYEWKPDGTNGIYFSTGDDSVTVKVVSGTDLSVAVVDKAITITLATAGSTITQIIDAILNSSTVGPLIHAHAIGSASTTITATLTATTLTGGNVRSYTENITIPAIAVNNIFNIRGIDYTCIRGVTLSPSSGLAITNNVSKLGIMYLTTKKAILANSGITTLNNCVFIATTCSISNNATAMLSDCCFYNSSCAINNQSGFCRASGLRGSGNTVGYQSYNGFILYMSNRLEATTLTSATPDGTIIGANYS